MKPILLILTIILFTISPLFGQNFTSHATIDQEFCDSSVLVIMNNIVGGINVVHSNSSFYGIEIAEIKDIFKVSDETLSRIDIDRFRQILYLRLVTSNKQNVLNVIENLRYINGVEYAEPNFIFHQSSLPDSEIVQLIAELDQYYCLWQLYESGCRSVLNVSRSKPRSLNEFLAIRQNILDRINQIDESDIINNNPVPERLEITSSNFPNPFNPETVINFSIPIVTNVSLEVFNIRGQRIKTLLDGSYELSAGSHSVIWDCTDNTGRTVGSGLYFYRIVAGEMTTTKKMLLMK